MADDTGLVWRKATASQGAGACVEVADLPGGGRAVRDSKNHETGPVLRFTPAEWHAFVTGVRNNEFSN